MGCRTTDPKPGSKVRTEYRAGDALIDRLLDITTRSRPEGEEEGVWGVLQKYEDEARSTRKISSH